MKTKILLLASILFTTLSLQAQAPEKFNYQGIARDNTGTPLANQNLGVQISILNPANTALYVEQHSVTTNDFGLYTLQIGDGTPVSGTMAGVNWAGGTKKIKVEIDPNGGTNYTNLGTTELLSVPYALYAAKAPSAPPSGSAGGDLTGNYPNPSITNNAVTSGKINNGAVKTADLDNNAVTTGKINNGAVGTPDLGNNSVTSSKIDNGAVATADIGNNAVNGTKIAPMGATNGQVLEYDGTNWVPATVASGNPGWELDGNAAGNNDFIGTTNNEDLRFKVSNSPSGFISANSGIQNTAFGKGALENNTTGEENTAFGGDALKVNTTGDDNVAVGADALQDNTTGKNNIAIGVLTLAQNTTANANIAIGRTALQDNTTGRNNVAVGTNALNNNTTADYNNAIGEGALFANTTGIDNVALGRKALGGNTTGDDNTAIGNYALENNTDSNNNTALGNLALNDNTTGGGNTAVGTETMDSNTTGIFNTAIGYSAIEDNTTGDFNVAVGIDAMGITSGAADSNTAVGGYTRISDDSDNSIALGYDANVNGSNEAVIGNTVTTSIGGFVSFSNLSDERFKSNMQPLEHGLDFIMKLAPITYHYDMKKLNGFLDRREGESEEPTPEWEAKAMKAKAAIQYTGFSAQQVGKAAKAIGYDFSGVIVPDNALDHYALAYAEFVVPLVKAVQEQQIIIEKLQTTILKMQARLEKIEQK